MESTGLFTPIKINSLELPNRIMMSPAFTNSATSDGQVTEYTIQHYRARAKSGIGLIMVEHTSVNSYYIHPGNRLQISREENLPGLSRLVQAVHDENCKIGIQIAHSIHGVGLKPEDLSQETCRQIVADFLEGAKRAYKAGFDVIELHFAHTYTLADFLSRRTNKRTDYFGGDIYERMRIHIEIIYSLRENLGENFPIFARFSADEFIIGGNTLQQTKIFARELEKAGIDCLDITAGVRFDDGGLKGYSDIRGKPTLEYPDGPNVYLAEEIKKNVNLPVITVGKLGNPEFAETVIADGRADMIAMARPLIADAMWVNKVKNKRFELLNYCVYCNNCLYKRRMEEDPIRCMERDCARCLTCLRICPYGVPRINEKGLLEFNKDWCDECGLCDGNCPAQVVRFQKDPKKDWVMEELIPTLQPKVKILVLTCSFNRYIEHINNLLFDKFGPRIKVIEVSCIGKVKTVDMLKILESEIEAIFIIGCTENQDCNWTHYRKSIRQNTERALEILNESVINKDIVYEQFSFNKTRDIAGRIHHHFKNIIYS